MTDDDFIRYLPFAIRLLKEGLIDKDDAWLLLNARDTPLWDDEADRFLIDYECDLNHGVSRARAVRHIHRLLNRLYGHDFY